MKSGKSRKTGKPRSKNAGGRQPPRKVKPPPREQARARKATAPMAPLEQRAEIAHAFALAPAMVRALDGRILLWGGGLESLYGWPAAEAVGRFSRELLATTFPISEADIQAELLERGEWRGELERIHRDGRPLIVGSQWVLHRNARGAPESVVEFNLDLTEARQAQAMIEEREGRLRSILETAPDAIITIDERGLMQSFSDAAEKLFGYAAGEAIGRNVNMLMSTPHHEAHDGYLERYMRTGEKRIIGIGREVEARRKDGTTFPIEIAVGEVRLGRTRIFTGFIRDLTLRVKMEQDLRQAQKMEAIGQLTGGVAHDFNNLLTVISGNLEMLENRLATADDRELLEQAREACQLGAQLANRLFAFGRRQSLQPKLVDLAGLVGGMVELLRRSLGATIAIETQLAPGLPMVSVDPGQVENALLNLAVNARDAMPKGGKLLISTALVRLGPAEVASHPEQAPGTYVTLAVTDTGSGMTPEVRQRAFEPFFTTKGPGAGSGLGLSMVYGFVKQSGGHVQLYSEPGLGTTVRLYLPVRDEALAAPASVPAAASDAAARGETVLLVEDDARVRQVSHRRLLELGYAVLQAENGPTALKVLDDGAAIDLLFTDIVMPGGMTGVDLAHEARRRRPGLKILFTSGYADPGMLQGGLLATDAGWLGKPYTMRELQAKLRGLLDR
jgi:PAS domain S-box-containing protein